MNDDMDHQVQTVDGQAKPIEDRLPAVHAASCLYTQYKEANTEIAKSDAKVIAIHRGKEPYDSAELTALGQGWRANLNMRELKGSINNRADTAYDLHMDLDTRITVMIRPEYKEQGSPNPLLDYGKIIAEEYSYTLNNDWDENYLFVDQTSRDRIKLGLGVGAWSDHLDWRPKAVQKLSFKTDPSFPPVASKVPACCINDTLLIQDLLRIVSNPSSAEAAGWDVAVVKKALVDQWKQTEGNDTTEPPSVRDNVLGGWAAFEQWLTGRPSEVAVFELEKLPVVRVLMRSASSERVSHYIMLDDAAANAVADDFLFKKIDQFDDMSHALWLNPYSYAEGTIGSLDGLGHDLAPYAEISNRMICSALDGGMMSGGLLLQAATGFDADEASVIRMGPSTLLPPGIQAVQGAFRPPIGDLLNLRAAVRGVYSNNVGMTRMSPELMETSGQGSKSREQVIQERNREFRLETNSANFEYLMWTGLHREVFRRLIASSKMNSSVPGAKEAKAFRERCISRGVPEDLLDKHMEALVVEVNRAVGDGSPQSRTYIWSQLMQLRGEMDEAGRRHTLREYSSSLVGYRNIDSIFPLGNRDQIPTNELSIAVLENNDFMEGRYIPAGSDQLHAIHLQQAHFKMLSGMVESYNQAPEQTDIAALLRTFSAALPHCQEHIQMLSMDETRKEFVKQATNLLKEFVIFFRRLEKDAQASQAEQDQLMAQRQEATMDQMRQQLDAETNAKLREVELKGQLEAMKQTSIAEVRRSKTEAQNAIRAMSADMKAQLDREIAERKLALNEEIERRKMELKEELSQG